MKFSIRHADKIVGLFVTLAIAILVFVVLMLGSNQRWFARDIQYITFLDSATGLSQNMAVTYRGFTMGQVRSFSLTADDRVEVIFVIFEEYNDRVREGSIVQLNAGIIPMLGNSFLFFPGTGRELLSEGAFIPEITSREAKELIARGLTSVPEVTDSIGNIIGHVESLLNNINRSIEGSGDIRDLPELGQLLRNINLSLAGADDPEMLPQLGQILHGVNQTIANANVIIESVTEQLEETASVLLDIDGPVFSLVVSSVDEILDSVVSIMNDIETAVGFIPAQLPQISLLLSDLHSTLIEAERLIVALTNNPLLRGGVPEIRETGPGAASPRDLEF